jgi:hypothetical protein
MEELHRIMTIVSSSIRWNGIDKEDLAVSCFIESLGLEQPITNNIIRCRCIDAVRSYQRKRETEKIAVKIDFVSPINGRADMLNTVIHLAELTSVESRTLYNAFYTTNGSMKDAEPVLSKLRRAAMILIELERTTI